MILREGSFAARRRDHRARLEELRVATDRVQRRAKLVTHRRRETRSSPRSPHPPPPGRASRFALAFQLGRPVHQLIRQVLLRVGLHLHLSRLLLQLLVLQLELERLCLEGFPCLCIFRLARSNASSYFRRSWTSIRT